MFEPGNVFHSHSWRTMFHTSHLNFVIHFKKLISSVATNKHQLKDTLSEIELLINHTGQLTEGNLDPNQKKVLFVGTIQQHIKLPRW